MHRPGRISPRLVLFGSIVLSLAIAYWGLAFNEGEIVITSEVRPVTISGMYDDRVSCADARCTYKVKPKIYELSVESDGYTKELINANVKRGKSVTIDYLPRKLPDITLADPTKEIFELYYAKTLPNQDTELWQRDSIDDQKLTTFTKPETIRNYIFDDFSSSLIIETNLGTYVDLNLKNNRKKTIEVPELWNRFRPLGDEWILWQENDNYFYAPYSYRPDTKLDLPINNLDQIVTISPKRALLVSQVALDGASSNQESSFLDLLELEKTDDDDKINLESPYFLYEIDLLKNELTYLNELDFNGSNTVRFDTRYADFDLSRKIYLVVDGTDYEVKVK